MKKIITTTKEHIKNKLRKSERFMKVYSDALEVYKNNVLYVPKEGKTIILCRCGCLGHFIFDRRFPQAKNVQFICHQKIRFDIFLQKLNNPKGTPKLDIIKVLREVKAWDLHPLMRQQEYFPWLKARTFDFAFMDSSADLFDRKFLHKEEGWSFCCHGTDVEQTKQFKEIYSLEGFLAIEKMEETYLEFFAWFKKTYPGKQVFFIHYPTALDDRKVYKERGNEILRIMKNLESTNDYIHNIHLEDSQIDWDEADKDHFYPYHFSEKTMNLFVDAWVQAERKAQFKNKINE